MSEKPKNSISKQCKKCGATISIGAERCKVCGAYTSSANHIMNLIFVGGVVVALYLVYQNWEAIKTALF